MKSLEMMRRQRGTKNNLKLIMDNNNWTSYRVSKKTGLSIKTIINIREDIYSNINSDTLLTISENLKINLNDLVMPFDNGIPINGIPIKLCLDDPSLPRFDSLLVSTLYEDTGMHFKIVNEYNNGHTINIRSQCFHKVHFSGNFLISKDKYYGIYLEIRDFDFYTINKYRDIDMDKLVYNLVKSIDHYAQKAKINSVKYSVQPVCRHDGSECNDMTLYSNSDDCIINALFKNHYFDLKENSKRYKINNAKELINKFKNDSIFFLTKKIRR